MKISFFQDEFEMSLRTPSSGLYQAVVYVSLELRREFRLKV